MQNKYSAGQAFRSGAALFVATICVVGFPVRLGAWTRASHGELAATAVQGADAFRRYASQHELVSCVVQAVQDADNESEKVFMADLEKSHAGIRMIRGDDPTKVQHTSPILAYYLPDDTRLHNAIECLKIATKLRSTAVTPDEHRAAMRIFGDGLHLVQDYFAHLNAPGLGKTGFSHGVGNLIDTDEDGVPDTPAGKVVDKVNWDCHSDYGNDLVPVHLRVIDYFYSPFWHKYQAKEQTWRYQAALHAGIEYMECYLDEDGVAKFTKTLADGYVTHCGVRTYLDLITHLVADNTSSTCELVGEWERTALPGCFMADCALATVKNEATAATWTMTSPLTGQYEVYLRWPEQPRLAAKAAVTIRHGSASSQRAVSQRTAGNRWNSMGRYPLAKGEKIAVVLTTQPGETIAADAVQLVRIPE